MMQKCRWKLFDWRRNILNANNNINLSAYNDDYNNDNDNDNCIETSSKAKELNKEINNNSVIKTNEST